MPEKPFVDPFDPGEMPPLESPDLKKNDIPVPDKKNNVIVIPEKDITPVGEARLKELLKLAEDVKKKENPLERLRNVEKSLDQPAEEEVPVAKIANDAEGGKSPKPAPAMEKSDKAITEKAKEAVKPGDVLINAKGRSFKVTGITKYKGSDVINMEDMESGVSDYSTNPEDIGKGKKYKKAGEEGDEAEVPELAPLPEGELGNSAFSASEEIGGANKSEWAKGPTRDANFKIEEAFKNSEFLLWLSNYEDARDPELLSHPAEIEKRLGVYEEQKILGKKLVDFYEQEVGENIGLPVSDEGKEAMLAAIKKEAIERPEALLEKSREWHAYESLKKTLEDYDQLLSSVGGAENREEALQKLKSESSKLEKKKMTQEWSVGFWKFINPEANPLLDFWFRRGMMNEEARGWQKDIQKAPKADRAKIFGKTDEEIEKIAAKSKKLEDWDEAKMRGRFDELKQEVFEKFEPTKALFGWLQKKTGETIEGLLRKPKKGEISLKNIEEARKLAGKLRSGWEEFGLSDPKTIGKFEAKAQERLHKAVEALLHKHISEMKITNTALDGLMRKMYEMVSQESDRDAKAAVMTTIARSLEAAMEKIAKLADAGTKADKLANTAKLLLLRHAWLEIAKAIESSSG